MEKELSGEELGGWRLAECVGYGKSALVFRASKLGVTAAVKVFDRELVQRLGKAAQRERVLREKSLVGKHHPNLIEILDAGEDLSRDLFFVVMAFFTGKTLAETLPAIPHERVNDLISQVASAARFLEDLGFAHRDIKPDNIGVSDDFSTAVLFDLGVLRPVGFSTITDQNGQRIFVGTLQYSPPELLQRDEQDSPEGWRAVTFYQLGGVLHDLLTRKPLFADDLTPYGHLVEVVSHKIVTIQAPGAAPELRMLAQDCLVKDPHQRLQLVSWERFARRPASSENVEAVKERIAQRRRSAMATTSAPAVAPGVLERRAVESLRNSIERILRDSCKQSDLPPFSVVSDDSSIARVSLLFAPSRLHAITATFGVYVEASVLDVAGEIVGVTAAAAISSDPAALPPHAPPEYSVNVFRGVRADDVLAHRLTNVLIYAMDSAQELCAQSIVKSTPHWLRIVVIDNA
jgi:eukaryotic-like serine/threonine-protein kinase